MEPTEPHSWDVYEEHLDEAEYLWESREQSLCTWNYVLAEVAKGPEERLLAHLDALVMGGHAVAEELLAPALESDEPGRVSAAAWVLLELGEDAHFEAVWSALLAADPVRQRALSRALELATGRELTLRLSSRWDGAPGLVQAGIIDAFVARGTDPSSSLPLDRLARGADADVLGAVLRAKHRLGGAMDRELLARGLESDLAETRSAAIELGLRWRADGVLARCRSLVAERAPERRLAMAALAMAGEPRDRQRLFEWTVGDGALDAVWALGFDGHRDTAEALLASLEDATLGAMAADSFAALTGLELVGDLTAEPPADADADEPLEPDAPLPPSEPDAALPRANAGLVRAWWQSNHGNYQAGRRYFRGEPWAPTLPATALEQTPTWRLRAARLGVRQTEASAWTLRGWARTLRPPAPAGPPQQGRHAPRACVVGLGARTAVGRRAFESGAAVRAGISRRREHPFLRDRVGDPFLVAMDASLPGVTRLARMEALLTSAFDEVVEPFAGSWHGGLRLFLGLPELGQGFEAAHAESIGRHLARHCEGRHALQIELFPEGNAAGGAALERALAHLQADPSTPCLVGGVDSWIDADLLEPLDEAGRVASTANRWGFPPGEGAALLALCSPAFAQRRGLSVLAGVASLGLGHEANRIHTETICVGVGLADALRAAAAGAGGVIGKQFCDLDGEKYREAEFAFAILRLRPDVFIDAVDYVAPVDCWGQCGAATFPLLMSLPIVLWQRGASIEERTMAWAGSENGRRAAVVIQFEESRACL